MRLVRGGGGGKDLYTRTIPSRATLINLIA